MDDPKKQNDIKNQDQKQDLVPDPEKMTPTEEIMCSIAGTYLGSRECFNKNGFVSKRMTLEQVEALELSSRCPGIAGVSIEFAIAGLQKEWAEWKAEQERIAELCNNIPILGGEGLKSSLSVFFGRKCKLIRQPKKV